MFQRELHEGMPSVQAKLLADVSTVSFYGSWTRAEFIGNVLAGLVFGN